MIWVFYIYIIYPVWRLIRYSVNCVSQDDKKNNHWVLKFIIYLFIYWYKYKSIDCRSFTCVFALRYWSEYCRIFRRNQVSEIFRVVQQQIPPPPPPLSHPVWRAESLRHHITLPRTNNAHQLTLSFFKAPIKHYFTTYRRVFYR